MALAFDASFYLSQNPDVAAAISRGTVQSAEQHYNDFGRFESRNPNAFFNTAFYLAQYPDVASARVNPFQHFLANGAAEGRLTNATEKAAIDLNGNGSAGDDFNAAKYVADYPDVGTAIANGTLKSAYQHFVVFGQFEGRTATLSNGTTVTGPITNSGVAPNTGTTANLTAAVDTLAGTSGNDTFNATIGGTAPTLNSFDSIQGGTGTDTLNIADTSTTNFAVPASVTFGGIENVNVSRASGGTASGALTVTDTTFGTGVQKFAYTDASAATAATGATVSVTLNSATDVSVAQTGGGTFTTVGIVDKSTTASDRGSVLKTVSVSTASGAVSIDGNAVSTVNLNAVTGLTTVNASAATRALTVNAAGTAAQGGLTDAQATSATLNLNGAQSFGTLTVAKATDVSINANAAASATLVAATAKTLSVGGTNLLTLTAGSGNAALETVKVVGAGGVSVDLSGITTLTSVDTTGSTAAAPARGALTGANTITLGNNTAFTGGAGQDVVTVGATTKAISLGAGNDTVNVTATALGTGGSINGGDGIDTLKLANVDAVTLSTAGATQTAFKNAVTGFEVLDVTTQTASTIAVDALGTFNTIKFVSASAAQVFSGVTTGQTFDVTYGAAGTSVTTNALTGASDVISLKLTGDLSAGVKAFGEFALPGVETVNVTTNDTNTTFAAQLATLTLTDANATTINVSGNNGLALTHTGTALSTFNASGVTAGAVTFTSAALTTDVNVTGSATGNDTLNFSAALGKVTITEAAGNNTLTGSSTAANTITAGAGNDIIVGGAAADTIRAGNGTNTITGGGGADQIFLGNGVDTITHTTLSDSLASAFDTVNGFAAGTDKIDVSVLPTAILQGSAYVATGTGVLATDLAAALTAGGGSFAASNAAYVTINGGSDAGTYLIVNDTTTGFQAANDAVIKMVGLTGTLSAADFV